jgi:hypothetical protein
LTDFWKKEERVVRPPRIVTVYEETDSDGTVLNVWTEEEFDEQEIEVGNTVRGTRIEATEYIDATFTTQ